MNSPGNHPLYNCSELAFKAIIVICLLFNTLTAPVYAHIAATEEDAVEYFNKGLEYAKQGKLNDAKEKFTWAITVKPDYTAAYYNLATVLMRKNDIPGAIDYYKQALTLDPQSHLAHNGLGYAYSKVGLWSKAIEEYNAAINIKPDFTPAHENLGQAYVAIKEWNLARQEYQKLVELHSPNANSLLKQIPKVIEPPKARLISLMPLESTTARENEQHSSFSGNSIETPPESNSDNANMAVEPVGIEVTEPVASNTYTQTDSTEVVGQRDVMSVITSFLAVGFVILLLFAPTVIAFATNSKDKWKVFAANCTFLLLIVLLVRMYSQASSDRNRSNY